jgi:hypothetical protein
VRPARARIDDGSARPVGLDVVRRAPRRRVRRRAAVEAIVIGSPEPLEVRDDAHEQAIIDAFARLLLAAVEAEDRALAATAVPS